ncbi:MAG: aldo/keto reductase [bacterium]
MTPKYRMNRRRFLKTSMTGLVGTGIVSGSDFYLPKQDPQDEKIKIKEYRTLGRTGFKVSDIGFGAGYLTNANVLEVALDMGMNYIDTAEHYVQGQSETAIGQVIKNRDRNKFFLTTKLNMTFGGGSTQEKIKERFGKCLERLQTDYVDCLMIHMTATIDQVKHDEFHAVAQELKSEGKVRFIGLSNHGPEHRLHGNVQDPMENVILAAAEDGRFDMALFVYNFLQKDQGERIIKACKVKNMGITLMKTNPVASYLSTKERFDKAIADGRQIPERYLKMLDEYKLLIDKAEIFKRKYGLGSNEQVRDAAIKFCLSHPDVHSVCPSMNSFEELETFVALSGEKLESSDTSMLNDYEATLGHLYCRHACGICESACPQHIPVNTIMRYDHYFQAPGREKHAMLKYAKLSDANASRCHNCAGHCVAACPYNIPIQSLLVLAHQNLTLA